MGRLPAPAPSPLPPSSFVAPAVILAAEPRMGTTALPAVAGPSWLRLLSRFGGRMSSRSCAETARAPMFLVPFCARVGLVRRTTTRDSDAVRALRALFSWVSAPVGLERRTTALVSRIPRAPASPARSESNSLTVTARTGPRSPECPDSLRLGVPSPTLGPVAAFRSPSAAPG